MTTDFVFKSMESGKFSKYFTMSSPELCAVGAYLFTADESPCYPCRVSLEDATIGETVLAITYEHHSVDSPYRSSGPIFIRQNAATNMPGKNTVPTMFRHRLLSIRGYSTKGLMIEADTIIGEELESVLYSQFDNTDVEYIHIHNANPGCFNCSVTRAL